METTEPHHGGISITDPDEVWRMQYVQQPGWSDAAAFAASTMLDAFLRRQEQQQSADAKARDAARGPPLPVGVWVHSRNFHLDVPRSALRDAGWYWALVQSYVLRRDTISSYVPRRATSATESAHFRTVKRRGVQPPPPAAQPLPANAPLDVQYERLVSYRDELCAYLRTEWEPQQQQATSPSSTAAAASPGFASMSVLGRSRIDMLASLRRLSGAGFEDEDDDDAGDDDGGDQRRLQRKHARIQAQIRELRQAVDVMNDEAHVPADERVDMDPAEKLQRRHWYGGRVRAGSYVPVNFQSQPSHLEMDRRAVTPGPSPVLMTLSRAETATSGSSPVPLEPPALRDPVDGASASPARNVRGKAAETRALTNLRVADFSHSRLELFVEILSARAHTSGGRETAPSRARSETPQRDAGDVERDSDGDSLGGFDVRGDVSPATGSSTPARTAQQARRRGSSSAGPSADQLRHLTHPVKGDLFARKRPPLTCNVLKLNNNQLVSDRQLPRRIGWGGKVDEVSTFAQFDLVMGLRFVDYAHAIVSVDLAENKLTSVPVELASLRALRALYLHGNMIASFDSVQALVAASVAVEAPPVRKAGGRRPSSSQRAPLTPPPAAKPKQVQLTPTRASSRGRSRSALARGAPSFAGLQLRLERFSLNGNPCQQSEGRERYRAAVLRAFPYLTSFDMGPVLENDYEGIFSPEELARLDAARRAVAEPELW